MPVPPVLRFAPSPNGLLHLGHAYSALLNADRARLTGGRLLLRIEDIDAARCRPEFERAIYEDLAWLGIAWEEPVRRQSEHLADYSAALRRLDAMGLVYPAFESRAEIAQMVAARPGWPVDPDGVTLYPGGRLPPSDTQRRIASGAPHGWRLDMRAATARAGALDWIECSDDPQGVRMPARPDDWGDVILARREMPTSYHLSVVVDDALQGVTEVVRGRDLFWATSVHRLLQALLDLPQPRYTHHALILDGNGRKLSKSNHATALRALRDAGATPYGIRRRVGLP